MSFRTQMALSVPRASTARITAVIVDHLGAAIPAASLVTLTVAIYDEKTGTVILPATNILNTGRGTVDANGNFALTLMGDDNTIVDDSRDHEDHIALVAFTWGVGGVNSGYHEFRFVVQNIEIDP